MPRLMIQKPGGEESEYELRGELRIGRAEGNDIVLLAPSVSRNHARFFVQGAECYVEDVGSANGTLVDGRLIAAATKVDATSNIVVGDFQMRLLGFDNRRSSTGRMTVPPAADKKTKERGAKHVSPEAVSLARNPPKQTPGLIGPRLRCLSGALSNKIFQLSEGVHILGRSSTVSVRIDDESVSRRHVEFRVSKVAVFAKDLGSSNGTLLNNQPLTKPTELRHGDILLMGSIEVAFEAPDPETPKRKSAKWQPATPHKLTKVALGLVVALVAVACVALLTTWLKKRNTTNTTSLQMESDSVRENLAQCREGAQTNKGQAPKWDKALDACDKVLREDPLQDEAHEISRKILSEQKCERFFIQGTSASDKQDMNTAIGAFSRIGTECPYYYFRLKPQLRQIVEKVTERASKDCKIYASNAQWEAALSRCEEYIRYACQTMKEKELYPPEGATVSLAGRLPKNAWRPKDSTYILFLKAREYDNPHAPPWKCPEIAILRPNAALAVDPESMNVNYGEVHKAKDFAIPIGKYVEGKLSDAEALLKRIRNDGKKAALHEKADTLLSSLGDVQAHLKRAVAMHAADKFEESAEEYRKALASDEILVLGESATLDESQKRALLAQRRSVTRRTIETEFAKTALKRGMDFYSRNDNRQACTAWKLGASFYRGNVALMRALGNSCSSRATQMVKGARNCGDISDALELAIDGDGVAELAKEKRASLKCE